MAPKKDKKKKKGAEEGVPGSPDKPVEVEERVGALSECEPKGHCGRRDHRGAMEHTAKFLDELLDGRGFRRGEIHRSGHVGLDEKTHERDGIVDVNPGQPTRRVSCSPRPGGRAAAQLSVGLAQEDPVELALG